MRTVTRRLRASAFAIAFAIGLMAAAGTAGAAVSESAAWGEVSSPNAGNLQNELAGISGRSGNDIWAVGRFNSGAPPTATGRLTLALHWTGASWEIVPTPNPTWPGVDFATLEDVAALGANDAWAVGYSADFGSLKSETLIERWNGAAWKIVASPNPGGSGLPNALRGVDAAGEQLWAVGSAGYPSRPLTLRFDGTRWRVIPNQCRVPLNDVDVLTSTQIWAVGASTVCRYDGTSWTVVPSPQPPNGEFWNLLAVSAAGPGAVWAVGDRAIPSGESETHAALIERWNGTSWSRVTNVPGQTLNGVLALGPNNAWAVGTDGTRGIVLHWNGVRWAQVPSPTPGNSGQLADLIATGTNHLWAAGTSLGKALILEAPSATQGTVVGDTNVGFSVVSWFGPETGSTETDAFGDYAAPGLVAGDYFFTVSNPGCSPASANVTVAAGVTVRQNFTLSC